MKKKADGSIEYIEPESDVTLRLTHERTESGDLNMILQEVTKYSGISYPDADSTEGERYEFPLEADIVKIRIGKKEDQQQTTQITIITEGSGQFDEETEQQILSAEITIEIDDDGIVQAVRSWTIEDEDAIEVDDPEFRGTRRNIVETVFPRKKSEW